MESETSGLLGMADIARLAQVKRPVVNMWIKRHAASSTPFPDPARILGEQRFYHPRDVVSWLEETGKGNNAQARADAAMFTRIATHDLAPVTALLALRALLDEPLNSYTAADLVDLADEEDPDDEFLYREIRDASDLQRQAEIADNFAEAAYTAGQALESICSGRPSDLLSGLSQTSLSNEAREFVARLSLALHGESTVVETTPGGCDLLLELLRQTTETQHLSIGLAALAGSSEPHLARLAKRRITATASGLDNIALRFDDSTGPITYLCHIPSPNAPQAGPETMLAHLDDLALDLDREDHAIFIGPSSLLIDALEDKSLDSVRATLLRSRRVHGIVSLPAGVQTAKPHQRMAMWIFGPELSDAHEKPPHLLVSDLSQYTLPGLLVADIVPQLELGLKAVADNSRVDIDHTRWPSLPNVVAASNGLVPEAPAARRGFTDYAASARATIEVEDQLQRLHAAGRARPEFPFSFTTRESRLDFKRIHEPTIGELLESKALKHLSGTRFNDDDLDHAADSGIGIWDSTALLDGVPRTSIPHFSLANGYPSSQLTEPGDIIFSTVGEVKAIVDVKGSHAIRFPARALRITRQNSAGLIPEVVANALICHRLNSWRKTRIRLCPDGSNTLLEDALAFLDSERQAARQRLKEIDDLAIAMTNMVIDQKIDMIDQRIDRKDGSNAPA